MTAEIQPDADGFVYLTETEGHVIGMTLPLHPDIEQRWLAGHLRRVSKDGSEWRGGGDYTPATPSGPSGDSDSDDYNAPAPEGRPARNASRRAWADYARSISAVTADEAETLTRDELIDRCLPPEEKPGD